MGVKNYRDMGELNEVEIMIQIGARQTRDRTISAT